MCALGVSVFKHISTNYRDTLCEFGQSLNTFVLQILYTKWEDCNSQPYGVDYRAGTSQYTVTKMI